MHHIIHPIVHGIDSPNRCYVMRANSSELTLRLVWQSLSTTLPLLALRSSALFGVKLLTLVAFGRVGLSVICHAWKYRITGRPTRCSVCWTCRRVRLAFRSAALLVFQLFGVSAVLAPSFAGSGRGQACQAAPCIFQLAFVCGGAFKAAAAAFLG